MRSVPKMAPAMERATIALRNIFMTTECRAAATKRSDHNHTIHHRECVIVTLPGPMGGPVVHSMGVCMDDKQMERYGALAGIVFVVLNIIGSAMMGSPPASDDSNEKVLEWFIDKDSGIKTAGFLGAISVIFMFWFLGTLWRHMSKAEGGTVRVSVVSAAGLIGSGALWTAAAAIQSAVAMRIDTDGAGASGFMYALSAVLMAAAGAFVAAHLLATNLLALRTKWLPSWHAGIGLLAGVGFVVSSAGTMTDSGGVMMIGMISFLIWAVWIILTALQMYRKPA